MNRISTVVMAAIAVLFASCSDHALVSPDRQESLVGVPVLSITAGNDQTGLPNTQLAKKLQVQVLNSGVPVVDARGDIVVAAGGGTVSKTRFRTNAAGIAVFTWTVGASGAQTLTVTLDRGNTVQFNAAVVPEGSTLTIRSGNNQTGPANDSTAATLIAELNDPSGAAIQGVPVSWTVLQGGGSLRTATSATNALGRASNRLRLGAAPGANLVQASVPGVGTVVFNATGTVTGAVLVIVAGQAQMGVVTDSLARTFRVDVRDASGGAISGVTVDWTVSNGAGGLRRATTVTNAEGATANRLLPGAGENTVRATVAGIGSVTFNATGYHANGLTITSLTPDTFNNSLDSAVIQVTVVAAASAGVTLPVQISAGNLGTCFIPAPAGAPSVFTGSCSISVPRFSAGAGTRAVTAQSSGLTPDTKSVTVLTDVPTTIKITNVTPDGWNSSLTGATVTVRASASNAAGLSSNISISTGLGSCVITVPAGNPTSHSGSCSFEVARFTGNGTYTNFSASVAARGNNYGFVQSTETIVVQTAVPSTISIDNVTPDGWNSSLTGATVTVTASASNAAGLSSNISIGTSLGSCVITVPDGNPTSHSGSCSFDVARFTGNGTYTNFSASVAARGNNYGFVQSTETIVVETAVPTTISIDNVTPDGWNSSLTGATVTVTASASNAAGLSSNISIGTSLGSCVITVPADNPTSHTGSCSFDVARFTGSGTYTNFSASVAARGNNYGFIQTTETIVVETAVPTNASVSVTHSLNSNNFGGSITYHVSASSAAGLNSAITASSSFGSCSVAIPDGNPTSHSGSCSATYPITAKPTPGTYSANVSVGARGNNYANSNSTFQVN